MTGKQLKLKGMSKSAQKHKEALARVREAMFKVAFNYPRAGWTADDARFYAESNCLDLGNAAGSVFTDGNWEFTGRWVPSQRPEAHRRYIRVWRLKCRNS